MLSRRTRAASRESYPDDYTDSLTNPLLPVAAQPAIWNWGQGTQGMPRSQGICLSDDQHILDCSSPAALLPFIPACQAKMVDKKHDDGFQDPQPKHQALQRSSSAPTSYSTKPLAGAKLRFWGSSGSRSSCGSCTGSQLAVLQNSSLSRVAKVILQVAAVILAACVLLLSVMILHMLSSNYYSSVSSGSHKSWPSHRNWPTTADAHRTNDIILMADDAQQLFDVQGYEAEPHEDKMEAVLDPELDRAVAVGVPQAAPQKSRKLPEGTTVVSGASSKGQTPASTGSKQPQKIKQGAASASVAAEIGADQKALPNSPHAELAAMPDDFDWATYVRYYPDLAQAGITSEESARRHYRTSGYLEGRVYKQMKVLLRYCACGGLINQHYSHLAGVVLGVALGAHIVMPPALARNSFAHYFSQDPKKNQVRWSARQLGDIWEIGKFQKHWQDQGAQITLTPHTAKLPDLSHPEVGYATWLPQGFQQERIVRMPNIYLRSYSMDQLIEMATRMVLGHATKTKDQDSPVILDLPCTLFMFKTAGAQPLVYEVAKSLHFSPKVNKLADKVVAAMRKERSARWHFNGLHLRMELDAQDWAQILGGPEKLTEMYLDACKKATFSPAQDLYLASGLLTYNDRTELREKLDQLKPFAKKVFYKEMFLSRSDLDDLTTEQNGLVDFLVLAKSERFVGISVSTFSYFLREYRAILGKPKNTTILVDGSKIGTDGLFAASAVVTANQTRR